MSRKTVLVTGASRGIGKAIALAFAGRGCNVVINCLHNETLLRAAAEEIGQAGADCLYFVGDVGDYPTASRLFQQITDRFGRLDILVNNAGISWIGLFSEMKPEEWDRLIRTNLTSVYNCTTLALPGMTSAIIKAMVFFI